MEYLVYYFNDILLTGGLLAFIFVTKVSLAYLTDHYWDNAEAEK